MKKLDDLVKSLTDDPKTVRNIREYAAKVLSKETSEGRGIYVDEKDFYNFIIKTYKDKYPELIEKIQKIHKRNYVALRAEKIILVDMSPDATKEELREEIYRLREENKQLKPKAEKWDNQVAKLKANAKKKRTEKKLALLI